MSGAASRVGGSRAGVRERLRSFARTPAARDALIALVASRLLIWAVGVPAFVVFGVGPDVRFDHSLLTQSQGPVGNALIAPAVRWDSNWYVDTAVAGYLREDRQPVFFPFYPLPDAGPGHDHRLGAGGRSADLVRGLLRGPGDAAPPDRTRAGLPAARRAVFLLALFPFGLFFSALYTEALFLALELGAVWAARKGRWWLAGLLGAAGGRHPQHRGAAGSAAGRDVPVWAAGRRRASIGCQWAASAVRPAS